VGPPDRVERIGADEDDFQFTVVEMLELKIAVGGDGEVGVMRLKDVVSAASCVGNQEELQGCWTWAPASRARAREGGST
jgi:hypothetical protein